MRLMAALGVSLLVLVQTVHANGADWPTATDTPVIEPVTVGLAGSQPADIVRYLMARGARGTAISPDGSKVAFSYRVTGEPQLWVVDANGGWPRQLTYGSGIRQFHFAPDGERVLVTRDADGNEREGYYLLSLDGTVERALLPQSDAFRAFGMFSPDGSQMLYASTERNGRDFDIYAVDIASAQTRMVYQGSFGFFPRAWQPGGDLVIVDETRGEDANDVHLLNVRTGEMTALFQPEVAAAYGAYQWLPDGSGFYLYANQDREFAGLARYTLDNGVFEFIATPDHDVDEVALTADGRYLAWLTNEGGYSKLHAIDRESGARVATPQLPAGVYGIDFARRAPVLSIKVTAPAVPGDVYTWQIDSGALSHPVRSTLGGLDPATFVTPVSLTFPARDGITVQGLLYMPTIDTDARVPVVIDVHGGPTAQARPTFAATTQYLVNKGIAVFDINVRGSTGFGKTYARLDNQEKRLDSVRDLVDAVAFLRRDPRLNGDRVAVMGGSYGGYMVNAVVGAYPDVFAAGASFVGVSDWVRALEDASPGLKASDRIEYGDITEPRWQKFYKENSPINNAHRIKVPMFFSHGVNDPRDPVTESDRIVKTIRENGSEVTYLRFPDEGHSISKQANRVAFNRALAAFLETHLSEADAP